MYFYDPFGKWRNCFMSDKLRPLSFEKLMGLLIEEHNSTGSIFGV